MPTNQDLIVCGLFFLRCRFVLENAPKFCAIQLFWRETKFLAKGCACSVLHPLTQRLRYAVDLWKTIRVVKWREKGRCCAEKRADSTSITTAKICLLEHFNFFFFFCVEAPILIEYLDTATKTNNETAHMKVFLSATRAFDVPSR